MRPVDSELYETALIPQPLLLQGEGLQNSRHAFPVSSHGEGLAERMPMHQPPVVRPFTALPKIELHRHLEGALRLSTLVELAAEYDLPVPRTEKRLRPLVQVVDNDTRTWEVFLGKFRVLRQFFCSEAVIRRMTREAIADAASDGVRYLELRFTPVALATASGASYASVIGWVCEETAAESDQKGIESRLILSINRQEGVELGRSVFDAGFDFTAQGLVGVDLAGQEAGFDVRPFTPLFERARAKGLGVTIHAGEWAGPNSVRDALDAFAPERIGHGVRAAEDPGLVRELARRGVVLEVCPSSNVASGVVPVLADHPLPSLLRAGVRVTLNTDDPGLLALTLSQEFEHAESTVNLPFEALRQMSVTAAEAAFLPADARRGLANAFAERWKETSP